MSRFQNCASNELLVALKRLMRYIKGTLNLKLTYKTPDEENGVVIGYADADWDGDCIDRKSTSVFCFYVNNNLISWTSRKQNTVSLSSTEKQSS